MTFPLARGILTGMADTTSKPRWYCPTPGWLVVLLLATTGFLYLSERFQWFSFNSHTGWTVLLAVASVGVVLLLMLPWLVAALIVRWRFQFSIRSLLLLVVAVALPFSWLAVEMKKARDNKKALNEIQSVGGSFAYQLVWPEWVRRFVGDDDYFFEVLRVTVGAGRPGGASLPRMDVIATCWDKLGCLPQFIVVDTLSRNFGAGDENGAKDMGCYCRSIDVLRKWSNGTVISIHHSGHKECQRERGHSKLRADADTMISVVRTEDGMERIKNIKQKDAEEFPAYTLATQNVGLGDVSSLILGWGGTVKEQRTTDKASAVVAKSITPRKRSIISMESAIVGSGPR